LPWLSALVRRPVQPYGLNTSWRTAGEVIRALAWPRPEKAGEAIRKQSAKLPTSKLKKVASARSRLPTWMTKEVSALVAHG
jgi:hypothetical protein